MSRRLSEKDTSDIFIVSLSLKFRLLYTQGLIYAIFTSTGEKDWLNPLLSDFSE